MEQNVEANQEGTSPCWSSAFSIAVKDGTAPILASGSSLFNWQQISEPWYSCEQWNWR